jgi:hypothetical protein
VIGGIEVTGGVGGQGERLDRRVFAVPEVLRPYPESLGSHFGGLLMGSVFNHRLIDEMSFGAQRHAQVDNPPHVPPPCRAW